MRLVGAPAGLQARGRAAGRGDPRASKPGEAFFNNLDAVEQFRRAVRQQDRGEMPVTPWAEGARRSSGPAARARRGLLVALGAADALAQNPFGAPRPPAAPPPPAADGIAGWLLAKQAEFYRMLSGTIRSAKTDGSAVWLLMGISFAYGVFHAAGPGHGKAVISSYLVANEETWKRGIMLSFLSAFLQALVAVALVGIAAALLGATAGTMNRAVWWIEIASYLLIAAMGARLLWVKGRAFLRELAALRAPKSVGAAATVAHAHHHGITHHHDHGHAHHPRSCA